MVVGFKSFLCIDPNAVKDAPRPKPEEFKYSEPYLYGMSEQLLKEYPDSFKQVFGLATASQADINKVELCIGSTSSS